MNDNNVPKFDCNVDRTKIGYAWVEWKRNFELFLASKNITEDTKKLTQLLLCAGVGIQRIYYPQKEKLDAQKKCKLELLIWGKLYA